MPTHILEVFERSPGEAKENRGSGARRHLDMPVTAFHKGQRIPCILRDLSPGGAGLIVNNDPELPNRFNLNIRGQTYAARVVWRRRNRLGVRLSIETKPTLAQLIGKLGF